MNYKTALATVDSVKAQMGGIGTLELLQAYVNGRIALSREEADDFELILSGFRDMFKPVEG